MDSTTRSRVIRPTEHALYGPRLHPIKLVDQLARIYAYALVWIHLRSAGSGRVYNRFGFGPTRMSRWLAHRAPTYPYIFGTYLEHPEVFEDIDNDALDEFVSRMTASSAAPRMDEALRALLKINHIGLGPQTFKPKYFWNVLELPGSAGRYSSLLSQAYPELDITQNCTIVCEDWQRRPDGLLERAAAGVYALIAGAGERDKPRILDGIPDTTGEYNLILGLRDIVSEDEERIRRMLVPDGQLILLDLEPERPHLTSV